MPMLLLVHMSWGIGHVSPKYPLQRRLSDRTIETQRFICTNAPRFPCSDYFAVHRVILEHIQVVQKVLSFWKGGALNSARLHLQGWHPPRACFKKLFPRITLSLVLHCGRGISLYTHVPEMGRTPFCFMPPCATNSPSFVCGE